MKTRMLKRFSTIALATAMAVTFIPVMGTVTNGTAGLVEAKAAETSGSCGENMTWELDGDGVLTISGSGRMYDFADEPAPWYDIRSEIKSIIIGNKVTHLGMYAFWDCGNLTSVKLPDSLTVIGQGSFESCYSLKSITIPDSVTSIFKDAFYDCDGLEKIYIPGGVSYIADSVFDECSSVRKITVASGNKVYDSRENCNAIIETDENTLIRGCMNTIIPKGISCNSLAFTGFSLERVLRDSGMTEVYGTDVDVSAENTTLLGVAGTYMVENALDRINEIRREACEKGVPDPNDPARALTEDDYVPIQWSSALEYIARIRAAESAFTIDHKRTNGSDWSEISVKDQKSEEELMALSMASEELQGIELWYAEKEDWINQNLGADTGNYKQMIDPTNLYVGIGTFASARTYYENNVVGEFSKESGNDLDDTQSGISGNCIQKLEVSNDVISNPVICGFLEGATGDTEILSVAVDVEYDVEYIDEDPDYRWTIEGLMVLDDINWTSADESIVSIDADGKVQAKFPGETTITADFGFGTPVTAKYVVVAKPGWQKVDGYWYYFDPDGTMIKNAWKEDSKGWCYLGADGRMVTNDWVKDSKGYCWIASDGYMPVANKWIKYDGGWYYIEKGYRVQNAWRKDSKGWCWLQSDGRMLTNGWAKDSKGWCWMGSDGYWVSNKWIQYGGQWYYIKSNHYMAANEWAKDSGGWMYMDVSGKITRNKWVKSGGYWYYLKSNGYMATGTLTISGKTYKFDSSGRWIS